MRKFIAFFLTLSITSFPLLSQAFYYEGKCWTPQGKFKKCFLDFGQSEALKITYKDFEYQGLNREITGKSVQHLAMGEKAKHRWEAIGPGIYALGPFGALFLLWKKKMALFSLEYQVGKKNESFLFSVGKKQGPAILSELQRLSGKTVDFAMGK